MYAIKNDKRIVYKLEVFSLPKEKKWALFIKINTVPEFYGNGMFAIGNVVTDTIFEEIVKGSRETIHEVFQLRKDGILKDGAEEIEKEEYEKFLESYAGSTYTYTSTPAQPINQPQPYTITTAGTTAAVNTITVVWDTSVQDDLTSFHGTTTLKDIT